MIQQTNFAASELDRAIRHHQAGELDAARAIYRRILDSDPNHPDALNLSEVIAHQAGNQETAIRLIEQAISVNSTNASYYNNFGAALLVSYDYAGAERALLRATRLQSDLGDAYDGLGPAYRYLDRLEEALAAHQKAVVCAPGTALFREELGTTLIRVGEYRRASLGFLRSDLGGWSVK
jgi:Flp pilus assembly protein TadD